MNDLVEVNGWIYISYWVSAILKVIELDKKFDNYFVK